MTEFTINVKLSADDKLLSAIEGITSILTGAAPKSLIAQPVTSEEPNPAKATKASKAVKPAPLKEVEAKPEPEKEEAKPETPKPSKTLTVEEVRAKAMAVRESKGAEVIREALNELGAASVTALAAESYEEFIAKIEAA